MAEPIDCLVGWLAAGAAPLASRIAANAVIDVGISRKGAQKSVESCCNTTQKHWLPGGIECAREATPHPGRGNEAEPISQAMPGSTMSEGAKTPLIG